MSSRPASVADDDLQVDDDVESVTSVHDQPSVTVVSSSKSPAPNLPVPLLVGESHRAAVLPSRHRALEDRLTALEVSLSQVSAERSALLDRQASLLSTIASQESKVQQLTSALADRDSCLASLSRDSAPSVPSSVLLTQSDVGKLTLFENFRRLFSNGSDQLISGPQVPAWLLMLITIVILIL